MLKLRRETEYWIDPLLGLVDDEYPDLPDGLGHEFASTFAADELRDAVCEALAEAAINYDWTVQRTNYVVVSGPQQEQDRFGDILDQAVESMRPRIRELADADRNG